MTIRARYDGRVLVPVDPLDLAKDEIVEIEVRQLSEPPHGSPEAILRVLSKLPPVSEEAAREFERAIEEGKMPVRYDGIFDNDALEDRK
jgi:predicted DNA-binding antitoxin AbrB/MazE fold protein